MLGLSLSSSSYVAIPIIIEITRGVATLWPGCTSRLYGCLNLVTSHKVELTLDLKLSPPCHNLVISFLHAHCSQKNGEESMIFCADSNLWLPITISLDCMHSTIIIVSHTQTFLCNRSKESLESLEFFFFTKHCSVTWSCFLVWYWYPRAWIASTISSVVGWGR